MFCVIYYAALTDLFSPETEQSLVTPKSNEMFTHVLLPKAGGTSVVLSVCVLAQPSVFFTQLFELF